MDLAHLEPWLRRWSTLWKLPTLPDEIQVTCDKRLSRSLGRCHPDKGSIRLHPGVLDGPESLLLEVVCHEAAHVAVNRLHGRSVRPHGPEWAHLVRVAGFEPRVRMNPAGLPASCKKALRPRTLYRHRCRVCGATRTARRPVRRWRCRACHEAGLDGRLEITSYPTIEV